MRATATAAPIEVAVCAGMCCERPLQGSLATTTENKQAGIILEEALFEAQPSLEEVERILYARRQLCLLRGCGGACFAEFSWKVDGGVRSKEVHASVSGLIQS